MDDMSMKGRIAELDRAITDMKDERRTLELRAGNIEDDIARLQDELQKLKMQVTDGLVAYNVKSTTPVFETHIATVYAASPIEAEMLMQWYHTGGNCPLNDPDAAHSRFVEFDYTTHDGDAMTIVTPVGAAAPPYDVLDIDEARWNVHIPDFK